MKQTLILACGQETYKDRLDKFVREIKATSLDSGLFLGDVAEALKAAA